MTASSRSRARRRASAAGILTVLGLALAAGILALWAGGGIPQAWWPRTGKAFTADQGTTRHECALVVGPAKTYCEGSAAHPDSDRHGVTGAVWRLAAIAAGAGALTVLRLRSGDRTRRR
ncbi:hypothetical protein [Streptomyces sp. NPDC094468]|uniref:hypothetical protein n=1 Tax=Streptomyces sp. NPDC094468 TaxID=3366066 RepID=UPI003806CD6B